MGVTWYKTSSDGRRLACRGEKKAKMMPLLSYLDRKEGMNYAMKILNADLTIAATTFLVFLIYKLVAKDIKLKQFLLYFASLFLVGFSLALPLYLYSNYKK